MYDAALRTHWSIIKKIFFLIINSYVKEGGDNPIVLLVFSHQGIHIRLQLQDYLAQLLYI